MQPQLCLICLLFQLNVTTESIIEFNTINIFIIEAHNCILKFSAFILYYILVILFKFKDKAFS